ncbi:hypothetical protein FE257_000061 [Aspergillus nanangensis]|uniref:MIP transporter n=1 Tax=Aspergillus nanangensis TaxID=2582783 RepID=A0AAD4CYP9_ASPNN|nr:hypothetical protein FE257_000061 [Aspergillus nanangensis]
MDPNNSGGQPRARSTDAGRSTEGHHLHAPSSPPPWGGGGGPQVPPVGDWDAPISPTGHPAARALGDDESRPRSRDSGRRRRSSLAIPRQSSSRGMRSLARRSSLASRLDGKFTVGGPDETVQMRLAQQPFVQPGYADLNPSYEQATNAKPVWSLAKPLPRVVRSGMVPTKEELLQTRARVQRLAEHSRQLGLDVEPGELEKGRFGVSLDPRKMAAQVEDARVQRESNLVSKLLTGETGGSRRSSRVGSRMGRRPPSVGRMRRATTWGVSEAMDQGRLARVEEGGSSPEEDDQQEEEEESDTADEGDPLLRPGAGDDDDEVEDLLPVIDEKNCPEDLDPLVQELVESEVHNNHTTWSVIRTHHREALAESLAVFVQLSIGFCADLAVTLANAGNPNTTAWAWGFATMMAIYISGGVSGAHLNPAITLVLWFYRGFPKRKLPGYFVAQFGGAFCAALLAYGVYYESIQHYYHHTTGGGGQVGPIVDSFITHPRGAWISPVSAFFNEFVGTAVLTITILALGDDQNAPPGAGMNSLIVGLVITCLGITFSYQTGGALSPSRDFGPRLALLALGYGGELFSGSSYWVYGPWVGAISGAFVGAFLYDFMIFTGGESPVNYPLERTKRAMTKSRRKLERRLHV